MKNEILEVIDRPDYISMTKDELYKRFFNNEDYEKFTKEYQKMINDYDIFTNKNGKILPRNNTRYIKGVVTGVGNDQVFVKIPTEDRDVRILLHNGLTSNIRLKDVVLLEKGRFDYTVEKIIYHELKEIVAEYKIDTIAGEKIGRFVPENKNYRRDFNTSYSDSKNLVDGHKVVLDIEDTKNGPLVKLNRIIGHRNDPGVDIETKIVEAGAPIAFSAKTIEEAENLPESISVNDFPKRLDLTKNMLFTIDGEDAKDLDDAVECYKQEDGSYILGVHIADVAHYVKEGSALDVGAMERGTSIYLADRVVPMYPHKMSNGICSLNPYVDRLAMTCYMTISPEGEIISSSIHESVINSKKRFTYTEVNKILENKDPEVIKNNENFVETLKIMQELAHILRKNRDERGQIELEMEECKIIVDENGKVTDIKLRERGEGEKLIEDFMIAANEAVATTVEQMELPFLYRVHDEPEMGKMNAFNDIAKSLGVNVGYEEDIDMGQYIRQVLSRANSPEEKEILSSLFLRNLPKAIYDPVNVGHFGLGSDSYTHFTSPIRRYPDTIVHRFLKKYVINKEHTKANFNKALYEEMMIEIGESTSMQERRADQLERDVDDMKKAEFMEDKIGQRFVGKISGFIDKGFFVRLPNTVEGFVPFKEVGNFTYNREKYQAESGNKVLKIGDTFDVTLVGASKATSRVDFASTRKIKMENDQPNNKNYHKSKNKDSKQKNNNNRKNGRR